MSKNIQACFSHNSDDWKTPKFIYDFFVTNGLCVDLFPYQANFNQFDMDYLGKKLFCNPPFSKMSQVVDYLIHQYHLGNDIVLLCPARTDTQWFHKLLALTPTILFLKGRLHYNDSKKSAPFPSILLFLDHNGFLPVWSWDIISSCRKFLNEDGK